MCCQIKIQDEVHQDRNLIPMSVTGLYNLIMFMLQYLLIGVEYIYIPSQRSRPLESGTSRASDASPYELWLLQ